MDENWKTINGWGARYSASDLGNIRRNATGRILKPNRDPAGYLIVGLSWYGVATYTRVHRLVAATWIGPCPPGLEVDHVNGDRADNRAENLRYVTHRENLRTRVPNPPRGEAAAMSRLTEAQVREIRELAGAISQHKLGKLFGVSQVSIHNIIKRKTWAHVA